ncbi:MAG TPA: sigma factor-like helix-turn-helix DNA-binding protein [Polyangiaceae bacterium]|nr:sigma factor-like helix-turn-helix DNA-binding protein [Polyangiaceae bacterium]
MSAESGRNQRNLAEANAESRETSRPASTRQVVRRRSIRVARTTRDQRAFALMRAHELEERIERPLVRRDCEDAPRPCPFVACRYHLFLDVSPSTGTIKFNFPDLEVWELSETCALDVAAQGGHGHERTSELMNVTRERVRQIEAVALTKLKRAGRLRELEVDR